MPAPGPGGYDCRVPFLIDGNNLIHAVGAIGPEVGRQGLCRMLEQLTHRKERVCVVFDGAPPPEQMARQLRQGSVEAVFAAPRTADEVVLELIANSSAPRRLTVVSTDREIRRAARRRRCQGQKSDQFARFLLQIQKDRPRDQQEPREKRRGLTAEQTEAWLKEFRLDGQQDKE